jgi:hypothetical protein
MEYEINKTATGKFYATKNGKRFTRDNFARKWEARAVVKQAVAVLGVERLEEIFA